MNPRRNQRTKNNGRSNAEFSKDNFSQNLISTINNAIRQDKLISIEYHSIEKGTTSRIIEPMDVIIRKGKKNLVGWCQLREDWRTFRLDRITQVVLMMDSKFEPRESYNRADFEDENSRYNDSLKSDLPYSKDKVKTMSENKLNFSDDNSVKYSDDEEDLSL